MWLSAVPPHILSQLFLPCIISPTKLNFRNATPPGPQLWEESFIGSPWWNPSLSFLYSIAQLPPDLSILLWTVPSLLTPLLFLFLSWTAHTCACVRTYAHPWQSLLPYLASCFLPSLRISASMCSLSFPQGLCNVNEWSREWWGAWQTGGGHWRSKGPRC